MGSVKRSARAVDPPPPLLPPRSRNFSEPHLRETVAYLRRGGGGGGGRTYLENRYLPFPRDSVATRIPDVRAFALKCL